MERVIPWGIVVLAMTVACFWWPRAMRGVIGVFFGLMGVGVHGAFVLLNPGSYVDFARQAIIPAYGQLAEAVVVVASPVCFGIGMLVFEVALATLILGKGRCVLIGLSLGMVFLVAITPLGIEVFPNAILALGLWRLSREEYPLAAFAEFRAWRVGR